MRTKVRLKFYIVFDVIAACLLDGLLMEGKGCKNDTQITLFVMTVTDIFDHKKPKIVTFNDLKDDFQHAESYYWFNNALL